MTLKALIISSGTSVDPRTSTPALKCDNGVPSRAAVAGRKKENAPFARKKTFSKAVAARVPGPRPHGYKPPEPCNMVSI